MAGEDKFGNVDFLDLSNMIEIPDKQEEGQDESKETTKESKEPKVVSKNDDSTIYDDGSFELNKESSEEDKEDKKQTTPSNDVSDSSPSSPYLAFARQNAEEGVFDSFTDEEWSKLVEEHGEDGAIFELNKRTIESEVQMQVESYKKVLTPEDRIIFESKIKGLPLDEIGLINHNKQKYSSIKEDDLDDEDLQEEIVKHDLKLKGNTDDDIKDIIESLKETDKLKNKAKNSIPSVVNYYNKREKEIREEKDREEKLAMQEYEKELEKTKLYVESLDEIVPGLKLDKKVKEKLYNLMTSSVGTDDSGQPLNSLMVTQRRNPAAFTTALNYYFDLGLFNIDEKGNFKPDFSKITNKIQTKVSKENRKIFESNTAFQGGNKSGAPKDEKEHEDMYSESFKRVNKLFNK